MAHMIPCIYCGHCETDHQIKNIAGLEDEHIAGYRLTLLQCPKYRPKDRRLARQLGKRPSFKQ